jgi:hypothetical protein
MGRAHERPSYVPINRPFRVVSTTRGKQVLYHLDSIRMEAGERFEPSPVIVKLAWIPMEGKPTNNHGFDPRKTRGFPSFLRLAG